MLDVSTILNLSTILDISTILDVSTKLNVSTILDVSAILDASRFTFNFLNRTTVNVGKASRLLSCYLLKDQEDGAKREDDSSNSILEQHCGKWIHCGLVGLFNGSITDGPVCCFTVDSEKACSSPKQCDSSS